MKQAMPSIVGNEALKRRLCDDILGHTQAHAYILAGPHGSGKHTLAFQFAAALGCENKGDTDLPLPCGKCRSCRKILERKSPDILVIGKSGQSVKIEQIRNLKTDVTTLPNDLDDKIYIIEDADTMTPAAQNAFLLTLEEPPAFVHFFLLCEKPEKLLETVRSRAPMLRTSLLDDESVEEYLLRNEPSAAMLKRTRPEEFRELLAIASGSIGRALELSGDKERAPILKQRLSAQELAEKMMSHDLIALAECLLSLPMKQDELLPILTHLQNAMRDLLILKKDADAPLLFYTDREKATELAYKHGSAEICRLSSLLTQCVDDLSRNANIRLTLITLLSRI